MLDAHNQATTRALRFEGRYQCPPTFKTAAACVVEGRK
jgi:hypothetical protein